MKKSLVIMAAGIGSRYGSGIKQLASVGPSDELIIDYSIKDAIDAGFNKIVFIIRKDIEDDFKKIIGDRVEEFYKEKSVEFCYAFQSLNDIPKGYSVPSERTKPLGTGHAVLACRDIINEPFCVINADDYYGKKAFKDIHDFLVSLEDDSKSKYCLSGFVLGNTLSDTGSVTRGICNVEDGKLIGIEETYKIIKTPDGAESNGKKLDINSNVSMNMWGFTPDYMELLSRDFKVFLDNNKEELKAEFLIPIHIEELLKNNEITVDVIETNDDWYGITYKEDVEPIRSAFRKMADDGVYTESLY